jgi:hypothetical protein
MARAVGGFIALASVGLFKSKSPAPATGAAPASSPSAAPPRNCPTCGKSAEWVAQYSKHYCRNCSKYLDSEAPKAGAAKPAVSPGPAQPAKKEKKAGPPCPTCLKSSEWVEKYQRNYCRNCSKYLEVEEKPAAKPGLAPSPKTAVSLAHEPDKEPAFAEDSPPERTEGPAVEPAVALGASAPATAEAKPAFDPYKPMVIRTDGAGMAVKDEEALKAEAAVAAPAAAPASPIEKLEKVVEAAAPEAKAEFQPVPAPAPAPAPSAPIREGAGGVQARGAEHPPPPAPPKPAAPKSPSDCDSCGKPMKAVEQYGRYYCYNCKKYGPELPAKPKPPLAAKPAGSAPVAPRPVTASPAVRPTAAPRPSAAAVARDVPPPPDDEPAWEPEVDVYECPGCREQVHVGWEKCPVCTAGLPYYPYKDWGPA